MTFMRTFLLALCFVSLSVESASTQTKPDTTPKLQSHPSGQVTIYIFRPNSIVSAIWGRASSPDIKVNGHKVGELVAGTYLVINRPAGRHILEINSSLAGPWQSEVIFAAGQTYYFEIAPRPSGAPGRDLVNVLVSNIHGQFVPGNGVFAGLSFYSLDGEHGRTEIASLKRIAPQ
jgi:hypothetical protein